MTSDGDIESYEMAHRTLTVSGRDFGRLEGTVNEIKTDVKEIRRDMIGIDTRVKTVETVQAVLQAFHDDRVQKKEFVVQESEGRQMRWQTVALYVTLGVTIVVAISGWLAWGMR